MKGLLLMSKYYCTGQALTISMVDIKADSVEEAEAVMNKFIDKIGKVMTDEVRWDEADWSIEENVFDKTAQVWVTV
jgi:hypothetical protein